jgi:hypothetical protein
MEERSKMDDRLQKAFDFASDSTKQLITLSTGVLALTITFNKDIVGGDPGQASLILFIAWVLYLLSIVCGIWTLLALTGNLEPTGAHRNTSPSIRTRNVTLPSLLQISAFLLATLLTVIFGIVAV